MGEPLIGELVLFERRGKVAVPTLNRGDKRNALNLALWGELEADVAAQADLPLAAGLAYEIVRSEGVGPDFAERVSGRFG